MPSKSIKSLITGFLLICLSNPSMAAEEAQKTDDMIPGYVSLGDPMVLNLSNNNRKLTFLQIKADILVKNDDAKEVVKSHIPAIRHQLIVLLSEQSALAMKTPAKREQIRQQATTEIRDMLEKMANNKDIDEVLFSSFLVQ